MKMLFLIISAILGISTIGYAANEDPEVDMIFCIRGGSRIFY